MGLTPAELERRIPLWAALGRLWLPTRPSAREMDAIVHAIRVAGLSARQAHDVYLLEVAPVLAAFPHALDVPRGTFDPDWLAERIDERLDRPQPLRSQPHALAAWARFVDALTDHRWTAVEARLDPHAGGGPDDQQMPRPTRH